MTRAEYHAKHSQAALDSQYAVNPRGLALALHHMLCDGMDAGICFADNAEAHLVLYQVWNRTFGREPWESMPYKAWTAAWDTVNDNAALVEEAQAVA